MGKIKVLFQRIYARLFKINDTPQKIALGVGLGVFSGIIPGTGPVAALALAFILRANRAAALLGALLTNTWLSFLTFILSIKIGSAILKVRWQEVYQDSLRFSKDFHWVNLFELSVLKIILPVMLGYLVIAFFLGLIVYLVTLVIVRKVRHEDKGRADFSR